MDPTRFVTVSFATPVAAKNALDAVQQYLFPEGTHGREFCRLVSNGNSLRVPLTSDVSDYKAKSFLFTHGALPTANKWY